MQFSDDHSDSIIRRTRRNDYRSYDLLIKQTMHSQHTSVHLVISLIDKHSTIQ